jgi:hypothetical protein
MSNVGLKLQKLESDSELKLQKPMGEYNNEVFYIKQEVNAKLKIPSMSNAKVF